MQPSEPSVIDVDVTLSPAAAAAKHDSYMSSMLISGLHVKRMHGRTDRCLSTCLLSLSLQLADCPTVAVKVFLHRLVIRRAHGCVTAALLASNGNISLTHRV